MRVSARADYAVRALVELAARRSDLPVKAEQIADAQDIPLKFLENILADLRRAGFVESRRGVEGGYRLLQPATEVTVAAVIRAVEGPLASVRGERPQSLAYPGASGGLRDVWVALRASMRAVLEHVTIDEIARGALPAAVTAHTADPAAWRAP